MRRAVRGWLAGAALLSASSAPAQEWVEHERKGAMVWEYRILARKPGRVVETVERVSCLMGLRDDTLHCNDALEALRQLCFTGASREVTFTKNFSRYWLPYWWISATAFDCGGRTFRETLNEFYDARTELMTRCESRDAKWEPWGGNFASLGEKVCR